MVSRVEERIARLDEMRRNSPPVNIEPRIVANPHPSRQAPSSIDRAKVVGLRLAGIHIAELKRAGLKPATPQYYARQFSEWIAKRGTPDIVAEALQAAILASNELDEIERMADELVGWIGERA